MPRSHTNGLSKRCGCTRRKWSACDHPWHFEMHYQRTAARYGGKAKHRYSLDAVADTKGITPPRSKHDAIVLADLVRTEIKAGSFKAPNAPEPSPFADPSALTVADIVKVYFTRHVKQPTRRVSSQRAMELALDVLSRALIPGAGGQLIRFEQKAIRNVTRADVEAVRDARRAAQVHTTRARGETGVNRLLERARHLFNFAVIEGYIEASPFTRGGLAVIRLSKETPRDRRLLDANEEERLLQCAPLHLKHLIIAAIATGARLGELLSLQWRDVRTTGPLRYVLTIRAEKSKTNSKREIPVGAKLAAILTMRTHAADGEPFGPDSYVFGNEVGERVLSIKKSWATTVLRANGVTPEWERGGKNQLSVASRAAYREINLHYHDLRREAASRLVEAGATLVEAQHLLGHTSVSQTATYLASSVKALEHAIDRKEAHEQRLADARHQAAQPSADTAPVSREIH